MPAKRIGITKFGDFDFTQSKFFVGNMFTNFGQKRKMSTLVPYKSGSFRTGGFNASPHEDGNVQATIQIRGRTPADLDDLFSELNVIQGYGLAQLIYQPADTDKDPWYCWAECTSLSQPKEYKDGIRMVWQDCPISWHVPEPGWITGTSGWGPLWGTPWGTDYGTPTEISASGTSTDETVTVSGNKPTKPRITIAPGTGESCQNPTVQRIVNGTVYDEVVYTGTLDAGDQLVIDPNTPSALLNGVNAYPSISYKHARLLEMPSGSNLLRVKFANSSDAATVSLQWFTQEYGA